MTQDLAYETKSIPPKPSYTVAFFSGLIAWPIAFGAFGAGDALVAGRLEDAFGALFMGLIGTLFFSILPLAIGLGLRWLLEWAHFRNQDKLRANVLRILVLLVVLAIVAVAYPIWIVQMIAFIPATCASFVFGGLVLKALEALGAKQLWGFALGGALGGTIPALAMSLWSMMDPSQASLAAYSASLFGFWCVGGVVASTTVWIHWQVKLTQEAKADRAHLPDDLPMPQPQP